MDTAQKITKEPSFNESRIRAITKIYYSKPEVQKALMEFSQKREVVPRYFEGFGKRPDTLIYPSDIMSLVQKGATSFHGSEELWKDPLQIKTDEDSNYLQELREAWDLLIDIDCPYLDYSKVAAKLVCMFLERYGIHNYGLKFSGNKGFHIIVPSSAFPKIYGGHETKFMFPEWPRAITEFILEEIKPAYNRAVGELEINFKALEERTNISKDEIMEIKCPNCGSQAKKGNICLFQCSRCKTTLERKNFKPTKRKLKCTDPSCPGYFELKEEKESFSCEKCGLNSKESLEKFGSNKVVYSAKSSSSSAEFKEEFAANKLGSLDLVLVSSRHLFRMPYSLHEKTSLSSVVIPKEKLDSFTPKDADPLRVNVLPFYKNAKEGEAENLLRAALEWKKKKIVEKEKQKIYERREFEEVNPSEISEDMFPPAIKKLLLGLSEGRKRGLFVLITFLRALNFAPEFITNKVEDWNKLNKPPLKEGYVKSQLEWHLKQRRKILPPNYANESFYKDLNLLDQEPKAKNPVAEVAKKLRKRFES